jgi:uncharacterized protein (TIGR03437 family)
VRNIVRVALFLTAVVPVYASGPSLEANRGQFPPDVYFLARSGAVSTAVTSSGIVFRGFRERISLRLDSALLGKCGASSPVAGEAHYLALSPPITHVPLYPSIACRDIYPGIDWVVHTDAGSVEHDWKLAPGVDPRAIVMLLDGAASARVTSAGDLLLRSGQLSVAWKAPQAYQDVAGIPRRVQAGYRLQGQRIALQIGPHRRDLPLVIDPVIDFSYVVNGNNDDRLCQVALDGAGNIYIAGLTLSSDFETTPGAAFGSPVGSPGSSYQVFVRELSPDGSKLLYSTYLGLGELYSAHPIGMRVDQAGNVYLAANAFSSPSVGGTPIVPNGTVAVYKLAPGGDRLIYGTRVLGGFDYPDPVALAIDGSGNAYVGAGSTSIGVSKIDPTGQEQIYLYQTDVSGYYGGLADLAVGADGSVYLAGSTAMGGLVTTPGALKTTAVNPQDFHGYLIRLKPDGSAPIFATYIAGDYSDLVSALAVDSSGNAYVGGQTATDGHYAAIQGTSLGLSLPQATSAFVMKVDPQGSNAVFTALLPGPSVNALALDPLGNTYASGPIDTGGEFVSKVDPTGSKLLYYSTIPAPLWQSTDPQIFGMAADSSGAAYVVGSIASIRIPDTLPSSRLLPNGFMLKMDSDPAQCDLSVQAQPVGPSLLSSPVNFLFTIHNNGPASADNVGFSGALQGGMLVSCRASGPGGCGTGPQYPWASFASIPAGGSETVELQVTSDSNTANLQAAATVSTVTSDVNLNNNTATVVGAVESVPVTIGSNLGATFTVTGTTQPLSVGYGTSTYPVFAFPNSQFQVYWPSPQRTLYLGPVTFQSWWDGSTENPRTFTATPPSLSLSANFNFLGTPYFASAAVASAGSYSANGVSPGELVALFGFNLGQNAGPQIQNGRLTTAIGDTAVAFDKYPAPLVATNPGQINAVVPYEIAGQSTTKITVQTGGSTYSVTVPVLPAVPALFTANASGTGQAAALNQDSSPNSPSNPANPGDIVVLYGTGEGLVNPLPPDGTISSVPAPVPQLPITATIGGQPADVVYGADAPDLVAGVIQINARMPAGIAYSHHVPVAWSAGTYSSQPGVTIAVNDSPGPLFVYQPIADNLSLSSISIAPARIAADSDATAVTVSGAGFVDGMVVQWNAQARATKFLDSTKLQVTLTGNDLESPGLGSLAVWNAQQTQQVTQPAPLLVYLPLLNHDLVYDATRDRIYVAVAKAQSPHGSSIAVLNPDIGRIEQWVPLDVEPTELAISGDNQYLYVALGNIVRRFDLNSWTPDLDIPLGQGDYGALQVYSMVTLPGVNSSLAVSFTAPGVSPPYLGTAVFDGAQMRPTVIPQERGLGYLLGGPDAGTLYGADESGDLYTLALDAAGITIAGVATGLLGGDGDSVYAGGLLYDGWGAAVDPTIPSVVQTWDNQGLIVPLTDLQQVLILGDVPPPGYAVLTLAPVLTLHDFVTGQRLWSIALPVQLALNHGPMIRCGPNTFALRESQVYNAAAPAIDLFRLNLGP